MVAKKKQLIPPHSLLIAVGIPTVFIPGLILASVLGWNWKEGLNILKQKGGFKSSQEIFPKSVRVSKVIDGDTFETESTLTVRLLGINAPNRGERNYEEAKEYLSDLIGGEEVTLEYDKYQDDKYGRILAYVWEDCSTQIGCEKNKRMVNWVMLIKGLAKYETYKDRASLRHADLLQEADK